MNYFQKVINYLFPDKSFVKYVKPGDRIQIEWSKIVGEIGTLTCVNNDPQNRKILLRMKWGNFEEVKEPEFQQIILDYKCKELKNFKLLNPHITHFHSSGEKSVLENLEEELTKALEVEDYKRAEELRKKIESSK